METITRLNLLCYIIYLFISNVNFLYELFFYVSHQKFAETLEDRVLTEKK